MALNIRKEQLDALQVDRDQRMVQRCVAYLQEILPDHCSRIGERAVNESAVLAVAKAKRYGLDTERQVFRFLNVMYWLGLEFDSDPRYDWAQDILANPSLNAETRTDWLRNKALEVLRSNEQTGR